MEKVISIDQLIWPIIEDIQYLDQQMDPEKLNDENTDEQMRLLEIPKHQSIQDTNPQNSNARALLQIESM